MHDGLGQAVQDLRREMDWSQPDLAEAMHKVAKKTIGRPVSRQMIADWEHGRYAPSGEYRSALALVTMHCARTADKPTKEKLERLARRFCATLEYWQFHADMKDRENQGDGELRKMGDEKGSYEDHD
jgi:transcriptional regulator with XRE-family HTH domain